MILFKIAYFSLMFYISISSQIGINPNLNRRWYQTNFIDQRAELEWFNLGKCCASADVISNIDADSDSNHSDDLVWVEGLEYFSGDIDRKDDRVWFDSVQVGMV